MFCQESEARTELLRTKSRHSDANELEPSASSAPQPQRHINFFEDLEKGVSVATAVFLLFYILTWHKPVCFCGIANTDKIHVVEISLLFCNDSNLRLQVTDICVP